MSRNLLHKTKLEDLKAWLDKQGITHRPTNADYQILQIRCVPRKGPAFWACIFDRHDAKEHYTNDRRLSGMIHAFICNSRVAKEPTK